MLKFFRKIRQNMIKENKASKYMLYAIGEIILVVIGILIAVQVNNWNINRTAKIEVNQSLNKLLVELKHDNSEFNFEINVNDDITNALDSCLIILKEPKKYTIEKFQRLFINTNYTISFAFNRVTFDEFSGSGKLKKLDNTILSDSLINYYGDTRYKRVEEALANHVRDNIRPYTLGFDFLNFNDELDNHKSSDFNINKKSLNDYSSDIRIINAIRFKKVLHRSLKLNYKEIIPKNEYLIKAIEEELNN